MPFFSSFSAGSARSLGLTSGAPPGPPVINTSSSTATTVTINFTPVLGSFEISKFEYSLNGGAYTGNISGAVTTYQFTGLTPSNAYTVAIRAVDASDQISDPSNTKSQSTSAEIAPSAPSVTVTQVESSGTGNALNATRLSILFGTAAAGTYPVVYYQYSVYRGATLITNWTTTPYGPNITFDIKNLLPNSSHTVYVRGVATANGTTYGSEGSGSANTDTEIANSTPSVTITSQDTANVTFTRGTSSGGTYGVNYYEWVVTNSSGTWVNSGTTNNISLTVSAGVSPNETFAVYVRAISLTSGLAGGYGSAGGQLDPLTPTAPTLSFSSQSASERGNAYLSWNATTYATKYHVYRNGVYYAETASTSMTVAVSAGGNWNFVVYAGNRLNPSNFSGGSNTKYMTTGSTGVAWSMTTGAESPVRYFGLAGACDAYIGSLKLNIGSVPANSGDAGYKYIQTIGYQVSQIPGSVLTYTSVSGRRLYFYISGVAQGPPSGWEQATSTIIRREVPGHGLNTNYDLDFYENGVNLGGSNISNTVISVTPEGGSWGTYPNCNENSVNINFSIRGKNLYITGYQTTSTTYA